MKIYTNGYAIGGIGTDRIVELLATIPLEDGVVGLKPLTDEIDYKEWMGRDAEVKGLEKGVFIETEYIVLDEFLMGLSLQTEGVMQFCWYDNMSAYACSYFSKGEQLLERLTHVAGTVKDINIGGEFTGLSTQEAIRQLFFMLTGATIEMGIAAKGESWYFKNGPCE
jgi:hypothetical protein